MSLNARRDEVNLAAPLPRGPVRHFLLRVQSVECIPLVESDDGGATIGQQIDHHLHEVAASGRKFNKIAVEIDDEATRDYSQI